MKKLLLILITISLAIATVFILYKDTGFVVLGYGSWTIETSLSFFMLLFFASFFVLYYCLRAVYFLFHLGDFIKNRQQQRHEQKKYHALTHGLTLLLEGQWTKAEKVLLSNNPENLNYLATAYACQQQQNIAQRDQYLQQAIDSKPHDITNHLCKIQLQLQQNQDNDAIATAQQLYQQHPKHPQVLDTLSQVYFQRQQWTNLWALLPSLRKFKVLNEAQMQTLEIETLEGLLSKQQKLPFTWAKLPKKLRYLPQVTHAYVTYLIKQQQPKLAEKTLRETIDHQWHSDLIALYADIPFDVAQQLNHAERWIRKHYNDADLLLCLGRLCIANRLWGKAQQYLESSLNEKKSAQTYTALAALMVQMGELEQAIAYYQQAHD